MIYADIFPSLCVGTHTLPIDDKAVHSIWCLLRILDLHLLWKPYPYLTWPWCILYSLNVWVGGAVESFEIKGL